MRISYTRYISGDRIVIGTEDQETANILEDMYKGFNLPVFKTDIYSSEMIKYASNAFPLQRLVLLTKSPIFARS